MYLFLDTETGGLDPRRHSLLEVAALVVDPKTLEVVDTFHRYVKPSVDEPYVVTGEALRINQIDLREHFGYADYVHAVGVDFVQFLLKYAGYPGGRAGQGRRDRLVPAGWNVKFDLDFLFVKHFAPEIREELLTHRALDVQVVGQFLQAIGELPPGLGSLSSYIKHYRLADEQVHGALPDCLATLEVYRRFVRVSR